MDYRRVLTLHFGNQFSSRTISETTGYGKSTINDFLKRFRECKEISYPLPDDVTNEYLEKLLYQKAGNINQDEYYRSFDEEKVHRALARKGETLKHLWKKYNAEGIVDGKRPLSYRQYCRRYANWMDSKKVTFHIQRYPGINTELDYAGKTLFLHNPKDPEDLTEVTIFIAALSYSDYFYAEGMTSCDICNWIRVNNNAFSYFGGMTQTVTPDNCKVAVIQNKDWINPSLNEDYQAWAAQNGTAILPAKVRSPRWKPVVENHVKIVTMHILVEMEEMVFFSLEELNNVLWEKMRLENRANFTGLNYSRRDLFEKEEKESLLSLPESQYEYLERKMVSVSPDFSFVFDKVHYSMPRKYLKKKLEIRAGANKIYVYNEQGDLIRTHERSYTPKSWVVIPSDMPKEYSDFGSWNVPFFIARASAVGPETKELIQRMLERADYPVQAFRSCFGILRYSERYGKTALEACCRDAVRYGKCNYITNTISMYVEVKSAAAEVSNKPSLSAGNAAATGIYKDQDEKYSLENLLKRQEEGDFE